MNIVTNSINMVPFIDWCRLTNGGKSMRLYFLIYSSVWENKNCVWFVKINPQTFFNFCSRHVSLLRALAEGAGEFSEAELMRLVKIHSAEQEELPQTAWRNLCDLQILVPVEPGSDMYLLAEPVAGLLAYLQNEANPATPELIRGYVQSLESLGQRLSVALAAEDITVVKLAFDEITVTLRRIYADLDQTHHAILGQATICPAISAGASILC